PRRSSDLGLVFPHHFVYLSATVIAPYESGLMRASKPEPTTMPTTSRMRSRVWPFSPTSKWISTSISAWPFSARRSEEHTSELQSRENLVCRLLLEKKKKVL